MRRRGQPGALPRAPRRRGTPQTSGPLSATAPEQRRWSHLECAGHLLDGLQRVSASGPSYAAPFSRDIIASTGSIGAFSRAVSPQISTCAAFRFSVCGELRVQAVGHPRVNYALYHRVSTVESEPARCPNRAAARRLGLRVVREKGIRRMVRDTTSRCERSSSRPPWASSGVLTSEIARPSAPSTGSSVA